MLTSIKEDYEGPNNGAHSIINDEPHSLNWNYVMANVSVISVLDGMHWCVAS